MVKEGMKSVKGNASSIKLSTAPKVPNLPPKLLRKINAESGAHTTSENSPTTGIVKLRHPMMSISRQNVSEGKGLFVFIAGLKLISEIIKGC